MQPGQGVAQTLTAGLVLSGHAEIWHLVVLQFFAGTIFAVSYPAFLGMVPILLPVEERKAAFLLIGQAQSAVGILGPAVSGLLVATVGPGWALAVDATTYLIAAGLLSFVRLPPADRSNARPSVMGDFVAGWTFARQLGWVIPAASASLVFNALVSGAIGVLGHHRRRDDRQRGLGPGPVRRGGGGLRHGLLPGPGDPAGPAAGDHDRLRALVRADAGARHPGERVAPDGLVLRRAVPR